MPSGEGNPGECEYPSLLQMQSPCFIRGTGGSNQIPQKMGTVLEKNGCCAAAGIFIDVLTTVCNSHWQELEGLI